MYWYYCPDPLCLCIGEVSGFAGKCTARTTHLNNDRSGTGHNRYIVGQADEYRLEGWVPKLLFLKDQAAAAAAFALGGAEAVRDIARADILRRQLEERAEARATGRAWPPWG